MKTRLKWALGFSCSLAAAGFLIAIYGICRELGIYHACSPGKGIILIMNGIFIAGFSGILISVFTRLIK